MARPRKNPDDPKWKSVDNVLADIQNVGSSEKVPTNCKACGGKCKPAPAVGDNDLMVAVLMAGYIARGGPISHDMMLRQTRELVALIKGNL